MVLALDELQFREFFPGFKGKMIHGQQTTMAYWNIEEGAEVPMHSHHHEQVVNVFEGSFKMTVGSEDHVLRPGDVLVSHGGIALSPCRILDVFTPVREEYR